jgi:hypothetical protein
VKLSTGSQSALRVPDIEEVEVAEQPGQAEEAVQEIQLAHTASVRSEAQRGTPAGGLASS